MITRRFRAILALEWALRAFALVSLILAAASPAGFAIERLAFAIELAVLMQMIGLILVMGPAARAAMAACAMLDRDLDPDRLLAETAGRPRAALCCCALPWLHVAHRRALALALTGRAAEAASELDLLERAAARSLLRQTRATAAALGYHAASVALDAPRAERLWSALAAAAPGPREPAPARACVGSVLRGRSRLRELVAAGDWARLAALYRRAADTDRTALGRLLALRGLAAASERAGDAEGAARALRAIAEGAGGLSGLAGQARSALAGQRRCFAGDGDYPVRVPISPALAAPRADPVAATSLALGVGPESLSASLARLAGRIGFRATGASSLGRAFDAFTARATAASLAEFCVLAATVLVIPLVPPSAVIDLSFWIWSVIFLSMALNLVCLSISLRRVQAAMTRSCDPAALLEATAGLTAADWRRFQSPGIQGLRALALAWEGGRAEAERELADIRDLRAALCATRLRLACAASEIAPAEALGDARSLRMAIESTRALLGARRAPRGVAARRDPDAREPRPRRARRARRHPRGAPGLGALGAVGRGPRPVSGGLPAPRRGAAARRALRRLLRAGRAGRGRGGPSRGGPARLALRGRARRHHALGRRGARPSRGALRGGGRPVALPPPAPAGGRAVRPGRTPRPGTLR
ncbi:hypothetical protein Corgl_0018 [Coriobacterium glomerans PW2]|uniref:Uncharacterized protein n=1 Tax=Coriobacterium glomerans (strain ATCC 49209 / DSM 20642 / JCM 10262 / PW2) TaxID=700015 RepID=F2N6U9_CORGP|nr:hypothetical protein [Coriobacterium glomerans]AEB06148.1 hypothetical protein Corgl_0018 [Coriobacterium glomerans PW2]